MSHSAHSDSRSARIDRAIRRSTRGIEIRKARKAMRVELRRIYR